MTSDLISLRLLGHTALLGGLLTFILSCSWACFCLKQKRSKVAYFSLRASMWFQFCLLTFAFSVLIIAYITNDFTLKNVFENSHTQSPLLYRLTGSWGNHEGSMLLWLWIMCLYGLFLRKTGTSPDRMIIQNQNSFPFFSIALILYQLIFSITLFYVLMLSNPFEAFRGIVFQGLELNPILQDPALAIHPPMLYSGYVGFGVVFVLAVAGALTRCDPSLWLKYVRSFSMISWSFLTLGIMLGSWWAYYELGWGGWWFWDPVENASLMPWLVATSLLHLVKISKSQGLYIKTSYFFATLTFVLCLFGTFLVRSGSLSSVHSFAQDPGRGIALLAITTFLLLLLSLGYAFLLCQKHARTQVTLFSREGAFALQALIFMTLLLTVILGTTYPIFFETFFDKTLTVGTPYFQKTFVPISFILLFLMGTSLFLSSRIPMTFQKLWQYLERPLLLSVLWMVLWSFFIEPFSLLSTIGSGLAFWILLTSLKAWYCDIKHKSFKDVLKTLIKTRRQMHGMLLAHIGVAITIFGMTTDYSFRQETTVAFSLDAPHTFASFQLTLKDVERYRTETYMAERGILEVRRQNKMITTLYPEKRFYPSHQVLTTETALYPHSFSNLYIALGGMLEGPKWTLRLYHHPLVIWIWIGAILMALGGIVAMRPFRKGD
tara:strand:+ start:5154 stop:7133 length:1980 start_codon:yes stop_codon:yes gene_type:complete